MYQNGSQKYLFQYGNLRATEKAVYFRQPLREYSLILNKHNQKLRSILKIKISSEVFNTRVSISRTHLVKFYSKCF